MKIQILPDEQYLTESKDKPVIGRKYLLEDAINGTNPQNRAWHALIQEFYKWMLSNNEFVYEIDNIAYDFSCPDWLTLKDIFKKRYGAGFESFVYAEIVGINPVIKDCKTYEEIPSYIRTGHMRKQMIRGRLKSWADYRKKQRMNLMDVTINLMKLSGVDSIKFHEIIDGMERKNEG